MSARGGRVSGVSEMTCTASVEELERVAARGWRGRDTERLGEWLLRAAGGFTGRANSALPLGDPGVPVPDAVSRVERWYDARGVTPRFQVPVPGAVDVDAELDRRGWAYGDDVHVLV